MNMAKRVTSDTMAKPTTLPDAWVVRGERDGAHEDFNLRESVASINWPGFPNPFTHDRGALVAYVEAQKSASDAPGPNAPAQIWDFAHNIRIGALIVMPRLHPEHHGEVAIGWCRGPAYPVLHVVDNEPDLRLPVEWIVTDMPRDEFSEDTQRRFNSPRHTVSQVHDAGVVEDILQVIQA